MILLSRELECRYVASKKEKNSQIQAAIVMEQWQ